MKIAFTASEVAPFAKTGGLADVSGALPEMISDMGHEVKIFMPKYSLIDDKKYNLKYEGWFDDIQLIIANKTHTIRVYKSVLPNSNAEVYFIDYPRFYDREKIYTNDSDEDERFILFSKGVIEIIQRLQWSPDIIHCNDWQTGLIPLFIKDNYAWDKLFEHTATVFTIHNLGYQGIFTKETINKADIRRDYFDKTGEVEHKGFVNFLKAGINFSDVINTVSETYAKEVLTKENGWEMEKTLEKREKDFYGILNGVDYKQWDPETDKLLPFNYTQKDMAGKLKNKKALLEEFGMPFKKEVPLIGIVSRLAIQKGFDLIARSLEYLSKLQAQWIILGSGEKYYEEMFESFADMRPDVAGCHIGYNNELAHLIEAGSDMFLMPSRYEPCGLNQIYSLKYGTVPIVRKTGGLADTVHDWDELLKKGKKTGDGFSFEKYNGFALTNAVERAIKHFGDKETWNKIMMNGMSKDYSWKKSAEKYIKLYKKAIDKRK